MIMFFFYIIYYYWLPSQRKYYHTDLIKQFGLGLGSIFNYHDRARAVAHSFKTVLITILDNEMMRKFVPFLFVFK